MSDTMRIQANENIPAALVHALRERGHDVGWVREDMPGANDVDVLQRAQREERIVLTFDKDFGQLAIRERLPAPFGVILLRISMASPVEVARIAAAALEGRDDWAGHFSVVEDGRIRMVPLPEQ